MTGVRNRTGLRSQRTGSDRPAWLRRRHPRIARIIEAALHRRAQRARTTDGVPAAHAFANDNDGLRTDGWLAPQAPPRCA